LSLVIGLEEIIGGSWVDFVKLIFLCGEGIILRGGVEGIIFLGGVNFWEFEDLKFLVLIWFFYIFLFYVVGFYFLLIRVFILIVDIFWGWDLNFCCSLVNFIMRVFVWFFVIWVLLL